MKKKLPIGLQNLREMRTQNYGYWTSLVYCLFAALGVETRAEESSSQGQVDLVIDYQGRIWLLEFKLAETDSGQGALEQIKAQGYHLRYAGQSVTLIGMDFSREQRNLVGFAWERWVDTRWEEN